MEGEIIYIYFHIGAIGRYQEVISSMYNTFLSSSGLLDRITECKCFIVGPEKNRKWVVSYLSSHPKFKITGETEDHALYEKYTLDHLHQHAQESGVNRPFKVLYLHTKGVTKQSRVSDVWRHLMMKMLVTHYESCLRELDHQDTVGCLFVTIPSPHYSGNFWWTKSSYLIRLPRIRTPMIYYIDPELWIGLCLQKGISLYQLSHCRTTEKELLSLAPILDQLHPSIVPCVYNDTNIDSLHQVSKIVFGGGYDTVELLDHGLLFDLSSTDRMVRVIFHDPPRVLVMNGVQLRTVYPTLFYNYHHRAIDR